MSQQPPIYSHTPPEGMPLPGNGSQAGPADSADRSMAVLAHLSTIASMILSAGWLSFAGPLVVWLMYKDRSHFVRRAAAGAFNFNVGMCLLSIIGWVLIFTFIGAVAGIPVLLVSFVMQLWCHIRAAIKASDGQVYRYPMQLRILS